MAAGQADGTSTPRAHPARRRTNPGSTPSGGGRTPDRPARPCPTPTPRTHRQVMVDGSGAGPWRIDTTCPPRPKADEPRIDTLRWRTNPGPTTTPHRAPGGWSVSAAGQLAGRTLPGVSGGADEAEDQPEFVVRVLAANVVHGGAHAGVETEDLGTAIAEHPHADRPAIDWIAFPDHPVTAFEPVQNTGDGGGMQAGLAGKRTGAHRPVPGQQVQARQIAVVEVKMGDDLVVEQGQLDGQLTQRVLHLVGEPPPFPASQLIRRYPLSSYYGTHMICSFYRMLYRL